MRGDHVLIPTWLTMQLIVVHVERCTASAGEVRSRGLVFGTSWRCTYLLGISLASKHRLLGCLELSLVPYSLNERSNKLWLRLYSACILDSGEVSVENMGWC